MSQTKIHSAPNNGPAPRKWNPWPMAIIAWFVLFITGIASFIVYAARSQKMELVTPDYYAQEIQYQTQLDRARRAHQLDRGLKLEHDAARRELRINLPPNHSRPGPSGRIHFYRPSAAQLDRQLPLSTGADGVQVVSTASLQEGLWKVRIFWTAGNEDYYYDERLVISKETASTP